MTLKVIGAGLGRTGTFSLKFALEHLGFGPCYHMSETLASARKAVPLWLEAADGRPDWDTIFDGYGSSCDYPGCSFWRELAEYYPQSKIILTTRDPESWYESVSTTVFARGRREMFGSGPLHDFFKAVVYADFGERIEDRAFMTEYFVRRNQQVIDAIPPERLLVHSAEDGWEPLCAFLGVPVPDVSYPRVNSREKMPHGRRGTGQAAGTRVAPTPKELEGILQGQIARLKAEAFAPPS